MPGCTFQAGPAQVRVNDVGPLREWQGPYTRSLPCGRRVPF